MPQQTAILYKNGADATVKTMLIMKYVLSITCMVCKIPSKNALSKYGHVTLLSMVLSRGII